jgi:hypothetical protein
MRRSIGALAIVAATVGLASCAQKPPGAVSVIEDKLYTVSPAAVPVAAGIVVGELKELKVIERVEQGSGRIDTPAKLSGSLKLKNISKDQTVRLVGATVRFIDNAGNVINLEDGRTESTIRFNSARTDRLDPGQDSTDSVLVDVPAAALEQGKLKDIRLELTYLPSAFKHETVNLAVSIVSP